TPARGRQGGWNLLPQQDRPAGLSDSPLWVRILAFLDVSKSRLRRRTVRLNQARQPRKSIALKFLPARHGRRQTVAAVAAPQFDSLVSFSSFEVSGPQVGWDSSALH